ncbi:MAG: hypothetical protein ABTQ34_00085 [Bdellovibrionales bacterium]
MTLLCLVAGIIVILALIPEFARAQTLGEVMCNAAENVSPLANLCNGLAYILGALAIGRGLFFLVKRVDSPQTALNVGIMHIVGGACLMALPAAIGAVVNSMFATGGGGGLSVCTGVIAETGGDEITLDQMMMNLVDNIRDPMTFMLSCIAIVMGVFIFVRGLIKATQYGVDPRNNSGPKIVASLVFGALFFVIGQSLGLIQDTLFGNPQIADNSVISWTTFDSLDDDSGRFKEAVIAALTFFQLIGMIAFIRGLLLLKTHIETGQGSMAQGITHMLGGACAINIYLFLKVMDNTFGTGFL